MSDSAEEMVALELLFPGAPPIDEQPFVEAVQSVIDDLLRECRRSEFRAQLAKKREAAAVRRRNVNEVLEGGDENEESWRHFLRKPATEPKVQVVEAVDAGNSARRMLTCRMYVSADAANILGGFAFPSAFGGPPLAARSSKSMSEEDSEFRACFFCTITVVSMLFVAWATLFFSAMYKGKSLNL